jgi:hypothetical protein
MTFVGMANEQVESFFQEVSAIVVEHPDAADYDPEPVL